MQKSVKKGLWHLPNIHLLWDGFVAYDLWSHPGHRTGEGHLGALVAELFGRAEIRNLHWVVIRDQHAGMKHWAPSLYWHVWVKTAKCKTKCFKIYADLNQSLGLRGAWHVINLMCCQNLCSSVAVRTNQLAQSASKLGHNCFVMRQWQWQQHPLWCHPLVRGWPYEPSIWRFGVFWSQTWPCFDERMELREDTDWIWLRPRGHAVEATCELQISHLWKHNLLYCLFYSEWGHNLQNAS